LLFCNVCLFLSKDFVYRRTRRAPQLSEFDKLRRYIYCKEKQDTSFHNYIFADETTIKVLELPLYQVRQKGSRPNAQCVSTKQRLKVNLWGGISYNGPTPFVVSIKSHH